MAIVATGVIRRASADTSPGISDIVVSSVEATSTTVTWTTDRKTDSYVNISQDPSYCSVRNSGDFVTDHTLVIPDLDPVTTYFFKIRATDANGNQSFSGDYTFTTTSSLTIPALTRVQSVTQKNLAAKAIATIKQITNPAALTAVADAVKQQAADVINSPRIIGNPQIDVAADQVTVSWSTDMDADGSVYVEADSQFNPDAANPYGRKEDETTAPSKTHSVVVPGLDPATLYHYKVSSKGNLGDAGESQDLTFTTKAILPSIINPHLIKVQEHDATVGWGTPFPTAGNVVYTDVNKRKSLSVGDPSLVVTHIVQLQDLQFQTRYSVVVEAKNQAGDTVTSQPLYFVTTKDVVPPIISQVSNESTLYPGQDTKVQTIISWQTDEPAQCFMSYVSGAVKKDADTQKTPTETGFLTKHVNVVTTFTPATVYKYWVTCADADNNATSSEDFVLLTPEQQKSIIDLILDNFKGTFGWLNGVGGKKK
jgi:hypothetical protein